MNLQHPQLLTFPLHELHCLAQDTTSLPPNIRNLRTYRTLKNPVQIHCRSSVCYTVFFFPAACGLISVALTSTDWDFSLIGIWSTILSIASLRVNQVSLLSVHFCCCCCCCWVLLLLLNALKNWVEPGEESREGEVMIAPTDLKGAYYNRMISVCGTIKKKVPSWMSNS